MRLFVKICVFSPDIYTYGAMVIGGIIRDTGHEVSITHDPGTVRGEWIFLSLYSIQHLWDPRITVLVRDLKAAGSRVIIGGPIGADPEMVLGELATDLVITGEGEEAIVRLLSGEEWDQIPNCAFIREDSFFRTETSRVPDISRSLPLIPDDIGLQDIRGAQTYIETHRGCFGRCGFCQVPLSFGRKIRSRSMEEIFNEVRAFKEKGVRRIALIGGTGSLYLAKREELNENAFIDLLKGLADILGPRNVSCPDIRADCITDEILDAVRMYTIGWIFFGIESGSPHVLDLMHKGIYPDVVITAMERCRKHGVRAAGSFITGYPGESREDFEMTKDLITEISPDDVFISSAEPIPTTKLADLVLQTPDRENPAFMPHTGEYKSLHLTEAEARAFDLMLHADICRSVPRFTTDELYRTYLKEVRQQGEDIRHATGLLIKYHSHNRIA